MHKIPNVHWNWLDFERGRESKAVAVGELDKKDFLAFKVMEEKDRKLGKVCV